MCVYVRACVCVRAHRALHRVASWISAVHVVRRPARAGTSLSVASVCTPCPDLCLSTAGFGLGERPLARHCPAWRSLQNNGAWRVSAAVSGAGVCLTLAGEWQEVVRCARWRWRERPVRRLPQGLSRWGRSRVSLDPSVVWGELA